MIIYLHYDNVPLQFVQIGHIVRCIIANLLIVLTKLITRASLVVPLILKWTYTQTNEYNLETTCLRHNANLK
jgi:Na+/serine symporter